MFPIVLLERYFMYECCVKFVRFLQPFFFCLVPTATENSVSRAAFTKHLQSLHSVDCAASVCCSLL